MNTVVDFDAMTRAIKERGIDKDDAPLEGTIVTDAPAPATVLTPSATVPATVAPQQTLADMLKPYMPYIVGAALGFAICKFWSNR